MNSMLAIAVVASLLVAQALATGYSGDWRYINNGRRMYQMGQWR